MLAYAALTRLTRDLRLTGRQVVTKYKTNRASVKCQRDWCCFVGMQRLFFANAELFQDCVLDAMMASPTPVQWLVVGAEPITSVDVTAAGPTASQLFSMCSTGLCCGTVLRDNQTRKISPASVYAGTICQRGPSVVA